MVDERDGSERRPPEKRAPYLGGNLVLYVVIVSLGTLVAVSLMGRTTVDIPIGTLVQLIEKGAPSEENPKAEVVASEGSESRRVRYSDLRNVQIGPSEITGEVVREVIEPETERTEPQQRKFHTSLHGLSDEGGKLFALLKEKGFPDIRAEEPPSIWNNYLVLLLLMLPVIVLAILVFRRLGGTGSAIAFGRSRAKLYAQEDVGATFADVAGIDEAVDELREVVEFLKTPEKFRVLGGRIPKGVLLVGPPGTGKTLLAKAIAGEAGVPFFSLSGSDFVEMFVGVGAARVRDMFQQAQARAPCIVFIDELDALGKTRGTSIVGGHDEREQTLNALLVEMDGFNSNSGVLVMAATNRPETLDPALLRPGRFDRHVLVDRPDIRGREAILEVHVKDVKLDKSVSLRDVAAITSGFVGADLANLVNEAALLAARNDKKAVTMEEFNEGVERITAGLEKRQRIMSPDEKQRVAYHEAAHALVASSLPNADPVHKVSIIPRGLAALGYTMQRPEGDRYLLTRSELESRIQVLLAGTVAEELVFDDISTGAQNDLERATEIARSMVMDHGMSRLGRVTYRDGGRAGFLNGPPEYPRERYHSEQTAREIDEEIARIVDDSLRKTRQILEARQQALVAIAGCLMEKEVIDNDELKQIIEASCPNPVIVPGSDAAAKRPAAPDQAARPQKETGSS